MINIKSKLPAVLSGFGLILLAACSTSPDPRYFVLEAPIANNQIVANNTKTLLLVGPVTLSQHLKKRGIVSRQEQGRVIVHPFDRWVGDLDQNIVSVLTETLEQKRGPNSTVNYYSNFSADHDYAVKIHISKFDRVPGDQIELAASWQVKDVTNASKSVHSAVFTKSISGFSSEGTVAAMSEALADLAEAVNQSLPN